MDKPKPKKLSQIRQMEFERDEFKDKWMRTLAEFENFRKNTQRDRLDWIKYANEKILLEICDVNDNFEKALATEIHTENYQSIIKGIELIYQQINSVLKKNDVIKMEALGKDFDPNYHEAMSSIPSEEPENTIIGVIQNGYMIGEKVIRAPKVAVSAGELAEDDED
jgi:molecular chaperone GrpE